MKRITLSLLISLLVLPGLFAQEKDSLQFKIDSVNNSLAYKTGTIELESGNAQLKVPAGFRFLDRTESRYVLEDLWGNPEDTSVLGMLVPENAGVVGKGSWAFTISFDPMGYVKDSDAGDINYDDLLKEQQEEARAVNEQRVSAGYEPVELIGWAAHPYYDKAKKTLHWAKELEFGGDSIHTLNYNLRILGRKGIFLINAVAGMEELPRVQASIDEVLASVDFKEGHRYADFDSNADEVAAWTVGGLVAGKILAKAGFFAVLLKFWKLIALGLIGAGSAVWNFIRRKKETAAVPVTDAQEPTADSQV
ncbi:DUF2167 domain-containing protein [Flavihumibacter sp. CACIAM 22H1]|uniref:DUF2167 domain-containing protein n=1 Tax=Flavihumibacter sp. CACIAM 22H1 TaxID=1812911 RepID=UPI0007A89EFC|nr:DUF2167 domain-containing protein [Flavihumibacter sp. CACIAM 22H1]KYP16534.1 MAG: hypothetical protein A1D16_13775 [Flavihumibacter sp. CACIAM 22H1]